MQILYMPKIIYQESSLNLLRNKTYDKFLIEREIIMNIGIDLGGSHIGIGLVEETELKATVDKFFTRIR